MLAGSVVLSALVLAAWFPAGALYSQRKSLSNTSAELQRLRQQDHELQQENGRLSDPAEIARIARQQYQLVLPGQRAYQVLPPASKGGSAGASGDDPGLQPLAPPSSGTDPGLGATSGGSGNGSSGGTNSSTGTSTGTGAHGGTAGASPAAKKGAAPHPGLLGRIVQNLEFWR